VKAHHQFGSGSLTAAALALLSIQLFHPTLIFPVQAVGTATWLAVLLAGLVALLLFLPVALVLGRGQGQNLIDLAQEAAGRPGAILTALALAAAMSRHGGLVLRETAEMAISAMYPHTPQTFAVAALIMGAVYGAWGKLASIVRLGRLYLPFLLVAVLLALSGSVAWGRVRYLLPFWGEGMPVVFSHGVTLIWMFGPPTLFMMMSGDLVRDAGRLWRCGLVAVGSAALLSAATTMVFLMVYPLPWGSSVTFPLHEMTRQVLGGRFFEHLEGVWMCLWVFGTVGYLAALLHICARAVTQAFGMDSFQIAVAPLSLILMTLALFPPDQGQTLVRHFQSATVGGLLIFGVPLLIAAIAWLRRGRRHA
jgi:hypothetical protein